MREIIKVPLFVLPNVVFFPSTSLPLYIADEKYETLIQSAIQHNQYVGVSLEKDYVFGSDIEFNGHEIFGVGRPIIVERMQNGIQKILLKGFCRVRLLNLNQVEPFYEATAQVIHDENIKNHDSCSKNSNELKSLLNEWINKTITDSRDREQFSSSIIDKRSVVDYISTFLIGDHKVRQALLENTNLESRIEILRLILDLNYPFHEKIEVCEAIKDFDQLERTASRLN